MVVRQTDPTNTLANYEQQRQRIANDSGVPNRNRGGLRHPNGVNANNNTKPFGSLTARNQPAIPFGTPPGEQPGTNANNVEQLDTRLAKIQGNRNTVINSFHSPEGVTV